MAEIMEHHERNKAQLANQSQKSHQAVHGDPPNISATDRWRQVSRQDHLLNVHVHHGAYVRVPLSRAPYDTRYNYIYYEETIGQCGALALTRVPMGACP